MKKFTFLVAALCATMMANAAVIQIDDFNSVDLAAQADQTVTVKGVTLSFNGTIAESEYNGTTYRSLRVYAGKTLTVSCAEKITKIEVIGMAKKGADVTASAGTVVGGSFSADTYKYENGFDEPLFVVNDVNATSTVITPVKQIRLYGIRVTTDGEGGGEDPIVGGEEIALNVNYAEVTYYAELATEKGENFSIDFMYYNSEEDSVHAPYVSFDIYSASATAIAGSYSVAAGTIGTQYSNAILTDAELVAEADGLAMTAATLTLTYVAANDAYKAVAAFTAEDGKKYTINAEIPVGVFKALDTDGDGYYDDYEDYELTEGATAIREVEVMTDVYARDGRIYAEEGARIYTVTGLDVTRQNGQLNGIYVVKAGNKVAKVVVR